MPRAVATAIQQNFIKGLVTETTALSSPEDAVVDADNCVFDLLGTVSRRLGFDYEYGADTHTISKVGCAINTYQWKNVTGDGVLSFMVTQVGATLYFYFSSDASTSLSSSLFGQTIDLTAHQADDAPEVYQFECQFADGLSKLYVVHPCLNNFYITYDTETSLFTDTEYGLQIRDFEGVPDGLAITDRPSTLSDEHKYNLINQGWDDAKLTKWNTDESNYPNNADVWTLYKDLDDAFNPAGTFADVSNQINSQAAQGHYILSVYNGDRNTVSGLTGLPVTSSGAARTTSVAFFAGRAWYSGIQAAGYNSKIYFTQIITKDDQVGKCYQAADPTGEVLFDLLPDDGGVISIPEAGTIYKLFPMQNNLVVFGYRGVWLISGSTGLGFRATDYVVSKLGSTRSISGTSFVDVNGLPVWWNTDGIWGLQPTSNGGWQIVRLTLNSIQTFYDDIPAASKAVARGSYNPLDQVVTWVYRSTPASTTEEQYEFDSCLCFNAGTTAFYPWTVSPGVVLHGVTVIDGSGGSIEETTIIDENGDTVVDDNGDIIVGFNLSNISVSSRTKFLVSKTAAETEFTFAETIDPSYNDWVSAARPTSFESYFITGYKVHSQANKNFQSNYVTIYHEGTGSLQFQGVWDFSNTGNTGRYTSKQFCDFSSQDYDVNLRRLKMRGQGKALQYKVLSIPNQNFHLTGWSAWETSNSTP